MNKDNAILKRINKWDLVLIVLVLICALVLFAWQQFQPGESTKIRVRIDGAESYILNLSEDQVQTYGTLYGEITVEIKDGRARMLHSSCEEQICVHQGFIEEPGSSIVCIPNQSVIECLGTSQFDGVSR